MQAVILCGGLGTRLREVVKDVPKPMAPINGVPFMKLQVDRLIDFGVNKIVFATGYKKEIIKDFFGDEYRGAKMVYSEEDVPLLTGGAIKQALQYVDEEFAIVMNGDVYQEIDYQEMINQHKNMGVWETLAVKPMKDFSRYGNVVTAKDGKSVIDYIEKQPTKQGNVSLGVYIMQKNIFDDLPQLNKAFSHEIDYLMQNVKKRKHGAFEYNGYFVDIGIPEDYFSFCEYIKNKNNT